MRAFIHNLLLCYDYDQNHLLFVIIIIEYQPNNAYCLFAITTISWLCDTLFGFSRFCLHFRLYIVRIHSQECSLCALWVRTLWTGQCGERQSMRMRCGKRKVQFHRIIQFGSTCEREKILFLIFLAKTKIGCDTHRASQQSFFLFHFLSSSCSSKNKSRRLVRCGNFLSLVRRISDSSHLNSFSATISFRVLLSWRPKPN